MFSLQLWESETSVNRVRGAAVIRQTNLGKLRFDSLLFNNNQTSFNIENNFIIIMIFDNTEESAQLIDVPCNKSDQPIQPRELNIHGSYKEVEIRCRSCPLASCTKTCQHWSQQCWVVSAWIPNFRSLNWSFQTESDNSFVLRFRQIRTATFAGRKTPDICTLSFRNSPYSLLVFWRNSLSLSMFAIPSFHLFFAFSLLSIITSLFFRSFIFQRRLLLALWEINTEEHESISDSDWKLFLIPVPTCSCITSMRRTH